MRRTAGALLVVSIVGAVHAVRRGRPARFAGVRLPGSPAQHALTIGSPLSAPPVMLAALAVAAWRDHAVAVRVLAAMFLVGILGEPDTWSAFSAPLDDPVATACVAGYLVLPSALIAGTARCVVTRCRQGDIE